MILILLVLSKTLRTSVGCIFFPLLPIFVSAQQIQRTPLHFILKEGQYNLLEQQVPESLSAKRKGFTTYQFGFKNPDTLSRVKEFYFYSHTTPVPSGKFFKPIRTITAGELSQLNLMGFDKLIKLMREDDLVFNKKYDLYFIYSKNHVWQLHQVEKNFLFSDDGGDVIVRP